MKSCHVKFEVDKSTETFIPLVCGYELIKSESWLFVFEFYCWGFVGLAGVVQNTQEIKRTLFNRMEQDKTYKL